MKLLKILRNLIQETKGSTYEYGAIMIEFNFPEIEDIQAQINKNDLYLGDGHSDQYGFEHNPHITLLYGLHENVSVEEVKSIVGKVTFTPYIIHNLSLFKNEEFEVLKFDARGKNLHTLNKQLKTLPHTTLHTTYVPHLTVAYLKTGTGDKYVKTLGSHTYELIPNHIVFSKPDGMKIKINIKKNNMKGYDD